MNKVFFHYADRKPILKNIRKIKKIIEIIFTDEHIALTKINYIFCSDEYLLNINKQFLDHNYFTDIITFNLSDIKDSILGEVYISVDRVKENSLIFKTTIESEFLRVIFHGSLHLCGYLDKTKSQINKMRYKEQSYINLFKFLN